MSSPLSIQRPSLETLLAVTLISAAVLGFEVALTRVFSVLLRYHYAFLVISIAVCGLGLGGYAAQWLRRRFHLSLPWLATIFALTIALVLVLLLRVIFARFPEAYWLAAVLVLIPFTVAGIFLAEVFTRFPQWSGRLYAWDLAGAAGAAIAVVGLLQVLGAINACLAIALLSAIGGALLVRHGSDLKSSDSTPSSSKPLRVLPVASAGLLLALLVGNMAFKFLDIPAVPPRFDQNLMSLADKGVTQPLFTELATPGNTTTIIDTRWNAFARTDVVKEAPNPDTLLVYTNGNVPTNMMRWNGQRGTIGPITKDFPLIAWSFAVAPLGEAVATNTENSVARQEKPRGRVLSIGPGGGLDALMALHYGAKDFEGAEINPSIVGLMHDYREFNGGIYKRPDVHVVTAEGRAYVQQAVVQNRRYAMTFSALTKTATAGQGMALLESFIYTKNAFADYWDSLEDGGQTTVLTDQPALLARLFATALTMLNERGIRPADACRHIAMAADPRPGPYRFALVLQKSPMTSDQTFSMSDTALDGGLTSIWIPGRAALTEYGPYPSVASGAMSLDNFVAWWRDPANISQLFGANLSLDIAPCTDNRPFVLDLNVTQPPVFKQLTALAVCLALGLAVVSWLFAGRDNNESKETRRQTGNQSSILVPAAFILYFTALGIGFMMVEIPLAQKLILPLGYPTLALTVILFCVLLGGGIGSWFSQRFTDTALRRWAICCALGVAVMTLGSVYLLDRAHGTLLLMSLPVRCVTIGLLLLPLGFVMGTPFPAGLRLFAQSYPANVPLIWGLNGVASVVGSLSAAMGAKSWGFDIVLTVGAVIYVAASLLLALAASLTKLEEPQPRPVLPEPEPEPV